MTITDEQAKIIGREIGTALASKLQDALAQGYSRYTFGDRIVGAIEKGCDRIAEALRESRGPVNGD